MISVNKKKRLNLKKNDKNWITIFGKLKLKIIWKMFKFYFSYRRNRVNYIGR